MLAAAAPPWGNASRSMMSLDAIAIESGEAIVSHDVRVDPRLSKVDRLGDRCHERALRGHLAPAALEGALSLDERFR